MANQYQNITFPSGGALVAYDGHKPVVPDHPYIGYIEGDGIGVDVSPVMKTVLDSAVRAAYQDTRSIKWVQVYLGDAAVARYGENQYCPDESLLAMKELGISIKGPLSTPVGGGIRSLNVAIRQKMDLFACVRPVRYFPGVPSPVVKPESVDMVIFRENTEDIYCGIEWMQGTPEAKKIVDFLLKEMNVSTLRFPNTSSIGIKPVSVEGTERLVRLAIEYAIEYDHDSVTLVHKGNIMKFTEGGFRDWGYALAVREFGAIPYQGGPWQVIKNPNNGKEIVIKDFIADNFFQQTLIRTSDFDVIATMNLNGDYLSDSLAAQVGGIGIAPGANIGSTAAVFEATHGTAPKYENLNKANPGSIILSGEMMLRYMGWHEAADKIIAGIEKAIESKKVTYDFHRLMDNAEILGSKEFGDQIVSHM